MILPLIPFMDQQILMTFYQAKCGRRPLSLLHSRAFSLIGLPIFRIGDSPPATSDSQVDQVVKTCVATTVIIPCPVAAFSDYFTQN